MAVNEPLEEKVRLLTGADSWTLATEPPFVVSDGPAGVRGPRWDEREPSLSLPCPTAMAASWDEELVGRLAALLAAEARRKGVDAVLGPTVNLHRSPLGGRHFECFSEDPLLTARIGVAYVRALQKRGIAACAKHYVCNDSETERLTVDVRVGERALRELYLAPFEALVAAGVRMVMAAYNGVNGSPMSESPLLAEPLKGEWGFEGVVVSDWGAARRTDETARAALDLVMPGPDGPWGNALVEAVSAGRVPETAIDEKVRRVRRLVELRDDLSQDRGRSEAWEMQAVPVARDKSSQAALLLREAAAAGMVLLSNDGVLPFERSTRIALIGPSAARPRIQGGGSAEVCPPYVVSPLEGLRAAGADVVHAVGAYAGRPARAVRRRAPGALPRCRRNRRAGGAAERGAARLAR